MCAIVLDAELRCSALEGELRDAAGISWPKSLLLVPSLVFPPQPPGTELWFSWDWRGFVSSGILGSLRAAFPCMSSVLGCPLCVIQLCPVRDPAVPWTRSSCASNTSWPQHLPCSPLPCCSAQAWLCPSQSDLTNIIDELIARKGVKGKEQQARAGVWFLAEGLWGWGLHMGWDTSSLCLWCCFNPVESPCFGLLLCSRIEDIV